MNRLLVPIALGFAVVFVLSGCTTTGPNVVTKANYRVIEPPAALYNCPRVRRADLPDPDTLTNQQVADVVARLWSNNRTCAENMELIRRYVADAKARVAAAN